MAPNSHDISLHRRQHWQVPFMANLSAALLPNGKEVPSDQLDMLLTPEGSNSPLLRSRVCLLIVHGFMHGAAEYELHSSVLKLSARAQLFR